MTVHRKDGPGEYNPLAHVDYIKYVAKNPGTTAVQVANHFKRDGRGMKRNLLSYSLHGLLRMKLVEVGYLGKTVYKFHVNKRNATLRKLLKENK